MYLGYKIPQKELTGCENTDTCTIHNVVSHRADFIISRVQVMMELVVYTIALSSCTCDDNGTIVYVIAAKARLGVDYILSVPTTHQSQIPIPISLQQYQFQNANSDSN